MGSISAENYLKHIYELQGEEKTVTTNLLAQKMNVAPASVTDMVKRLSGQGFLRHIPYKGVVVTEKGKRSALKIIRKHRLWEMFLVEVLHFSWDNIDEEAEEFEHIMSERMEERVDKVLGYPAVDPHGDPIPDKSGAMKEIEYDKLDNVEPGMAVRVVRVNDDHPDVLKYISKIRLALNSKIVVLDRIGFDRSIVIKIDRKRHFLSQKMAESIFVQRMSRTKHRGAK